MHATPDTDVRLYGTSSWLQCDEGFAFSDTTSSIFVSCMEDGNWSSTYMEEDCQRNTIYCIY